MLIRVFVLLFVVQYSIAQELVTPLLDSLSIVSSHSEKSRISLKIASELSNTDWERSLYYLEVAETAALASDDLQIYADYFIKTGEIYYQKDALDVALDYYLKAYEFYKDKDFSERYALENKLAIVYARVENEEVAKDFFRRVYQYQIKIKDSLPLAKTLNNIGNLYLESQLDSSIIYYQKSLKIAKKLDNITLNLYLYTNLGRVFNINNQPKKSNLYFNKAISTLNENTNLRLKVWLYNEYSTYYLKQSQSDSSIYYANKSYRIIDSIAPYSLASLESVELLYNSYKLNKDFEKATIYFDSYNRISDTINIEEKKVNVEKILIEEAYKSKEKIQILKEGERRLKYYIFGLSLFVLLLILTILLVKYRTKLKNIQLEKELMLAKRKELDASLEIKNNELIGKAMTEIHRTEIIDEILLELKNVKRKAVKKETQQAIDYIVKRLEKDTNSDIWKEFEVRFEQVHESFYKNLILKHPDLTSKDKRLCALLKLDLTSKEIAQITGQSFKSVENARTRLRKKLEITNLKTDLSTYLTSFS